MGEFVGYVDQSGFDALESGIQEHYTKQEDGGYLLNVLPGGGRSLENVDGLKKTAQQERTQRQELERKLKLFGDLDPEAARAALAKVEEIGNWSPDEKTKEIIAAQVKQAGDKHQSELSQRDEKIQSLSSQLRKELIGNRARAALAKAGCVADDPLLAMISEIAEMRETDGLYEVVLKGTDGQPIQTKAADKIDPMGIGEYVSAVLKEKFPQLFKGEGVSGGGTPSTPAGGGPSGSFTMTKSQAEADPRAYRRLREEAAKVGKTVQILE